MKLLLGDDALGARAEVARNQLAPLAQGLAAELEQVERHELYIPKEKALLSRVGGRCERDGSTLEFDPFSPHEHRCPTCGTVHVGELHDRFWVFWYQLWLAERALHGAVLGHLLCDESALALSSTILERYADEYLLYPNRDNVLGPTRLFFSTYLESIWLLNLCIALDVMESGGGAGSLGGRVRERIIQPSAALIASYDEGASNRQVWNDAALIAAARLLDRPHEVERAVFGRSGVTYHLEHGLLADGTWYEGENYHLFAHRGLWYGVAMAERAGLALPAAARARFQEGFATPFLTALPDMTLPSRRDSQYAISLRQPRFAELCELGLARETGDGDARLRAMLRHLYGDAHSRREIGRWNSTADVERNLAGTKLSRADLGWRSLLFARPELPPLSDAPLGSVLLDAQGIAVFRRAQERVYVALDYGTSGGGHGHPDRLNVLLADGETRWLDDMGTGSYVDPSLHWYRSTLAHNTPLFNGFEQQRVDGELLAFEERGDVGWVSARAMNLYPGVAAMRTLVLMPEYLLDELAWYSDDPLVVDVPLHIGPEEMDGGLIEFDDRIEDVFGLTECESAYWIPTGETVRLTAHDGERHIEAFLIASGAGALYRLVGPGAPGSPRKPFLLLRTAAAGGARRVRIVWCWQPAVRGVRAERKARTTTIELADGTRDCHRHTTGGWRIERVTQTERTVIELGGVVRGWSALPPSSSGSARADAHIVHVREPLVFELAENQYRRSDETWKEAGRPTATVRILLASQNDLEVEVIVHKTDALTFAPASNPYDNESPDINADGVQLYFVNHGRASAWLVAPDAGGEEQGLVHTRMVEGWDEPRHMEASWRRTPDGYRLRARVVFSPGQRRFALGVVVNEKPPGRVRRRGQLVLGGAGGEFVYLRGDREDRERLPLFEIAD